MPGLPIFNICFGSVAFLNNMTKFIFKIKRRNAKINSPIMFHVTELFGQIQLFLGVWGITLTYPNINYLTGEHDSKTGSEECLNQIVFGAFVVRST